MQVNVIIAKNILETKKNQKFMEILLSHIINNLIITRIIYEN